MYVPIALALHAFVAWHVWHARREANDAMDYVQGTGNYAKDGGLSADIMDLVNERIAGGAVGAAGELVGPIFRQLGQKLQSALAEKPSSESATAEAVGET